jgi:hypothetical protein
VRLHLDELSCGRQRPSHHPSSEEHLLSIAEKSSVRPDRCVSRHQQEEIGGCGSDSPGASVPEEHVAVSARLYDVMEFAVGSCGCKPHWNHSTLWPLFKRLDCGPFDGLPVSVSKEPFKPNRPTPSRDHVAIEPPYTSSDNSPASVTTLDRSAHDGARHSNSKPCIDACGKSKRRGGTVDPPTSRGLVTGLVDCTRAELIRPIAEALIIHIRDQQGALAIGRESMPSRSSGGAHFDLAAGDTRVSVDRVDDNP